MMLGRTIKEHPYYTFFIALDVLLAGVVLYFLISGLMSKTTVDINVAPNGANVLIDGKSYANGIYEISPGKKEITVSAEGFESKTYDIDFTEDSVVKFYSFLLPENSNSNYYVKNPGDFMVAQSIGGDYVKKIEKIVSIRNYLPIIDFQYGGLNGVSKEIVVDEDTVTNCGMPLCLYVTGDKSEGHIETATLLKQKGFDINEYGVRYVTH